LGHADSMEPRSNIINHARNPDRVVIPLNIVLPSIINAVLEEIGKNTKRNYA